MPANRKLQLQHKLGCGYISHTMKSEGLADAEKDARCGGRSGATLAAPLGSLAAALRQARAEGKNKTSREAMACLATESPMSQTGTSKRESPRPASGG
mmetsp:Transcript_325/g.1004  ORF Transcript_325/g.1004 Transcript_325/m.1004 type:complete len:98 (+) Transcript_325:321-614(+)